MPIKKNTRKGIEKRLERALASLKETDSRYPNLNRPKYEFSQEEAYVKKHPETFNWQGDISRKMDKMFRYSSNQYKKRRQQLVDAANRLMANASNGG